MIRDIDAVRPRSPLAQTPETNHLLHSLIADLEGSFVENVGEVGIPSGDVLPMGGEMGAHEAQGGIVELEADADASLVSHDAHDSDTYGIGMNVLDAGFMRSFDEHAYQQTDEVLDRQLSVGSHGIVHGIIPGVEGAANPIHPELTSLLTLVFDGDVDGVEIDHLLESHDDEVGGAVLVPVGAEPGFEGFVFALGIDVPCADKDATLFVLSKFILRCLFSR